MTLLAATVLHERVSGGRWAQVGGGFVGALIVIRPGAGLFGWPVLLPLAGMVAYVVFQLLTRTLSGQSKGACRPLCTGRNYAQIGSVVARFLL